MRMEGRRVLPMLLVAAGCGSARSETSSCPTGQHDGGEGTCAPDGACAAGYYDDGGGTCRAPGVTNGRTDLLLRADGRRQLELVLDLDNAAGMGPKLAKLSAQFPSLIAALKDPIDGSLPDLRIGIIDGDLGTGCSIASGACGPKGGDPSLCFGDQGRFQMLRSPAVCQAADGADFLEIKDGQAVNFGGPVDNLSNVLACLTGNLGSQGCGYQHQLQAFELALVANDPEPESAVAPPFRPTAALGLIFVTDEDDCSAATSTGMFGVALAGEAAGLRCATRAHACAGRNLADSPPGYPTTTSFSHPFGDCRARMDACPAATDSSVPTGCSPLESVKRLANVIKSFKADPERQILVAGIFGWPRSDQEMAAAEYQIGLVPNPSNGGLEHPTVFASFPVCYDPDHLPTRLDANGFDDGAFGWAGMPGLRNSAFVDEFGANGLKFSICERDFSAAMTAIGSRLARLAHGTCLDTPHPMDADPATPGVQADCKAFLGLPDWNPAEPVRFVYRDSKEALSRCADGASDGGVTEDCWRAVEDPARCSTAGLRVEVLRSAAHVAAEPRLPVGTRIHLQCRNDGSPDQLGSSDG